MTKLNKEDIDILFFAFRYALGRRTAAVPMVADYMKNHWDDIDERTQRKIQEEIACAIDRDEAGDDCDQSAWLEIQDLPRRENARGQIQSEGVQRMRPSSRLQNRNQT